MASTKEEPTPAAKIAELGPETSVVELRPEHTYLILYQRGMMSDQTHQAVSEWLTERNLWVALLGVIDPTQVRIFDLRPGANAAVITTGDPIDRDSYDPDKRED